MPGPRDPVLEIAARRGRNVARPHEGPGPAAVLAFAGRFAGGVGAVGGQLDVTIVAAQPVDGVFEPAQARLDDAGAAHTRHAAFVLDPRRHHVLQPAGGGARRRARIRKAPGPAARVALATGGAHRRIAVAHLEAAVITAEAVKTGLRLGEARAQPHADQGQQPPRAP